MSTEHARLPLWLSKNAQEKERALIQLANDLDIYAQINGKKDQLPSISEGQEHDTILNLVLNLYRAVLQEERNRIMEYLHQHQPADAKEALDIKKMIRLIEENPNIFNMNCEVGHLTGSALVVDINSGSVLLHLHKKLNKWLQFGGHPEYETDFSQVALRESTEETGLPDLAVLSLDSDYSKPIDIDLHTIPEGKGKPEHLHLDLRYVLGTQMPEAVAVDSTQESNNFVWFKFEDVKSMGDRVDAPLARLIQKAHQIYRSLR